MLMFLKCNLLTEILKPGIGLTLSIIRVGLQSDNNGFIIIKFTIIKLQYKDNGPIRSNLAK